ncbi:MAG: hypothetical protein RJA36_218 [Pseudomonadota bacterium]|jgi:HlyD family secretion protein
MSMPGSRRRIVLVAAGVLVAASVVIGGFVLYSKRQQLPEGLLQSNGRIEGDEILVAPKVGGRVSELLAREGDVVEPGRLLARLTDDAAQARLAQAETSTTAQEAQVKALRTSLSLLESETEVQLSAARAELAGAKAELARANSQAQQSARELERVRQLRQSGFVGPQSLEQAELAARSAADQSEVAQASVERARQNLRNAKLGPQRVQAKDEELAAARAQARSARARQREAASYTGDLEVRAPTAAHVVTRYVNPGEVVAAGAPLLGLTDLRKAYLKAYVPEPMVGRLRLGQPAQIWTDAYPDQPFDARVGYIASRAEFTPKEVQTRDERTKLVFEIRLYPSGDSGGKLLPGQPADAMIKLAEGVEWRKPLR